MAQACRVCNSPKRKAIEAAIGDGTTSKRAIAVRFGLGKDSVGHHVRSCIPAVVAPVLEARGITIATRTNEMARRVGEVFAKLDEVMQGEPCPTCGATSFTPAQALESGFLDMKLKAAITLGKVAELEFGKGNKAQEPPRDWRQEWAALAPSERRVRLAEMKHRLLELEAETHTEGQH